MVRNKKSLIEVGDMQVIVILFRKKKERMTTNKHSKYYI
tara:strand:- start:22 stop:138 length:117 start_codon:yes stop_codon:yes gene_type:complete